MHMCTVILVFMLGLCLFKSRATCYESKSSENQDSELQLYAFTSLLATAPVSTSSEEELEIGRLKIHLGDTGIDETRHQSVTGNPGNLNQSFNRRLHHQQPAPRAEEEAEADDDETTVRGGREKKNHEDGGKDISDSEAMPEGDYPTYVRIPQTLFSCRDKFARGYYADIETRCQVFHLCDENRRGTSFMCPIGSIFNQRHLVCDWWYNFDCETAPIFYPTNEIILGLQSIDPGDNHDRTDVNVPGLGGNEKISTMETHIKTNAVLENHNANETEFKIVI